MKPKMRATALPKVATAKFFRLDAKPLTRAGGGVLRKNGPCPAPARAASWPGKQPQLPPLRRMWLRYCSPHLLPCKTPVPLLQAVLALSPWRIVWCSLR